MDDRIGIGDFLADFLSQVAAGHIDMQEAEALVGRSNAKRSCFRLVG